MKINFQKSTLMEYAPLAPVFFPVEGVAEQIVPDTMPDAERILRADACLQAVSCSAAEGRVSLSAVGDVCVLYRDTEGGVQSLRLQVPLRQEGVLKEGDTGFYRLWLRRVECTAPNPRKVSVRLIARLMGELFTKWDFDIPEAAEEPDIEQCIKSREITPVTGVINCRLEQTEELSLPESAPAMDAMLCLSAECTELSCKAVPGKAVIKGNLLLSGEYLSGEKTETVQWKLPFTRIAEGEDITEESGFSLSFYADSAWGKPADGSDGRSAEISVSGTVCLLQTEKKSLSYITDAYSTAGELTLTREERTLWSAEKEICLSADFSDGAETEMTEITGQSGRVSGVYQSDGKVMGEGVLTLSGKREERSCYLRRRFSFEIPTDKCAALLQAELRGLSCTLKDGRVESKGEIVVWGTELSAAPLRFVSGAEQTDAAPCGEGVTLSVCRIEKGEEYFLLGKSLRAPMKGIYEANGIREEIASESRVLIIPRR